MSNAAPPHPPLPPGWEQAFAPGSGQPYYANRSTGETSWTPPCPPPYFPPPPPPPAPLIPPPPPASDPRLRMLPAAAAQPQPQFRPDYPQLHTSAPQPIPHFPPEYPQPTSVPQPNPHFPPEYPQLHTSMPPYPPRDPRPPAYDALPVDHAAPPPVYLPQPEEADMRPPNASASALPPHVELPSGGVASGGLGPSTATTPGLLVSSVRAMLEGAGRAAASGEPVPRLELEGLTAGAIADLCNVSSEIAGKNVDGGDFAEGNADNATPGGETAQEEETIHYAPLQPFTLPLSSLPPHIEPGRVDIRLHALHAKLAKI